MLRIKNQTLNKVTKKTATAVMQNGHKGKRLDKLLLVRKLFRVSV